MTADIKTEEAPGAGQSAVAALLDDAPVMPIHRELFGRIGIGLFFDIFDLYIAAAVAGALVASGEATLQDLAPLTSFTLAGMMIGSLIAGLAGDRFGRRLVFRWSLVLVGASSVGAALAPDITTLIGMRFVTGIGLGAEAVLAYAAFAEFLPRAVRGRWLGFMGAAGHSGVIVAAIVGYLVIPALGWRWLFAIAAVGATIAWLLRRNLPESPRWLEARGRHDEARAVAERMLGLEYVRSVLRTDSPAVNATQRAPAPDAANYMPFARALFIATIMNVAIFVSIFAFLTWLPSIMVAQGHGLNQSLLRNVLMSGGAILGTFASGFVADAMGRKAAVSLIAAATGIFVLCFSFSPAVELQTVFGFLLYASVYGLAVVSVSIYAPELFATSVRLRGVGLAVTIGRLIGILTPFALPWIYLNFGLPGAAIALAAILALEVLIVLTLGRETKAASL